MELNGKPVTAEEIIALAFQGKVLKNTATREEAEQDFLDWLKTPQPEDQPSQHVRVAGRFTREGISLITKKGIAKYH